MPTYCRTKKTRQNALQRAVEAQLNRGAAMAMKFPKMPKMEKMPKAPRKAKPGKAKKGSKAPKPPMGGMY